ncbi:MAG: methyltransferase domain-containing protein [Anaerofustis stercorihominis]|nr:methyltransferase domain-containing protein [Anaerofustis stercorihominis]
MDFLENSLLKYWSNIVISNSPKKTPLRILQLNCDEGYLSLSLSAHSHLVTGVDIDSDKIARAKSRRIEEVAEPDFYVGDVFSDRFKSNTFDVIVARGVFSVYKDDFRDLVSRIKDILKPKGKLLIFDCDYTKADLNTVTTTEDIRDLCKSSAEAAASRQSNSEYTSSELFDSVVYELGRAGFKVKNKIKIKDPSAYSEGEVSFYGKYPMYMLEGTKADNEEDEENEISLFWQKNNDVGTDRCIKDLHSFKRKAWGDMIERYAPKKKKKLRILDIGTSSGFLAITMALRGHDVCGIDISNSRIAAAVANAERMNAKVNFICSEADDLPFGNEEFDLIINRNVVWNLPNPEYAFSQWYRVLVPSGRVVYFDGDWVNQPMSDTDSEYFDFNRAQAYDKASFSLFDDSESGKIFSVENSTKKKRPEWDRRTLSKWGLIPLAIRCDVSDQLWDDYERGLYFLTPQFVVVAEKMVRTDFDVQSAYGSANEPIK